MPSHKEAVQHFLDFILKSKKVPINDLSEIDGIGFKTI